MTSKEMVISILQLKEGDDMTKEEKLGKGVEFERIRRITGYLGTVDRFNKAKQAEVKDRVKHK